MVRMYITYLETFRYSNCTVRYFGSMKIWTMRELGFGRWIRAWVELVVEIKGALSISSRTDHLRTIAPGFSHLSVPIETSRSLQERATRSERQGSFHLQVSIHEVGFNSSFLNNFHNHPRQLSLFSLSNLFLQKSYLRMLNFLLLIYLQEQLNKTYFPPSSKLEVVQTECQQQQQYAKFIIKSMKYEKWIPV